MAKLKQKKLAPWVIEGIGQVTHVDSADSGRCTGGCGQTVKLDAMHSNERLKFCGQEGCKETVNKKLRGIATQQKRTALQWEAAAAR